MNITQLGADIQMAYLAHGLCLSTADANTIRFLPPLVVRDAEIERGLEILKAAL